MKLSSKIANVFAEDPNKEKNYYSFEYFPPKTDQGVENLLERIERMGRSNPFWVDVTWNAGGVTSDITLELCAHIQKYSGLDVLMHLTCTFMTREKIIDSLDRAKELGIRNLLCLRGDPPRGAKGWVNQENGFNYAVDLVRFVKERYGDYFCICVAAYPEVHLEASSREDDIKHLKEKVDAGADFIITQLFFDNRIFYKWVEDCRAAGIECLIIPGIMPILGYERFQRMISFTKTAIPEKIFAALEPLKNDDEAVQRYGVQFGTEQTQDLMAHGFQFIHYYTMNLEQSILRMITANGTLDKTRELPFKRPTGEERKTEEVRPIFWAVKPKSYVDQTHKWDNFPNGRWGVSRAPSFDAEGSGFVSFSKGSQAPCVGQKCWGTEVLSTADVAKVFIDFIEKKIKKFPFSEGPMTAESSEIKDTLLALNHNKFFTINSQPRVNGVSSTHPTYGWGPEKGFVYQKAYFEFFIPSQVLKPLVTFLEEYDMITYQAVNKKGEEVTNVSEEDNVNAVTWGVFRSKEIIQPTVVDNIAFKVWKDEAFRSWTDKWAVCYEKDSPSSALLNDIAETYYLVNIVDNDFVNGDLCKVMLKFIALNQQLINEVDGK